MYVDFNGKRVDLGFGKKTVAALVTVAIVGGGLLAWQMWPRERIVYVNRPVQQGSTQQAIPQRVPAKEFTKQDYDTLDRLTNKAFCDSGYWYNAAVKRCVAEGTYQGDRDVQRKKDCPMYGSDYYRQTGDCGKVVQ